MKHYFNKETGTAGPDKIWDLENFNLERSTYQDIISLIIVQAVLNGKTRRKLRIEHYRPKQKPDDDSQGLFLQKLHKVLEENLEDYDFRVPQLCKALAMSPSKLYRTLKSLNKLSASSYIRSIRLRKSLELLRSTECSISDIAWEVGFKDPNYFTRAFRKEFGLSPGKARLCLKDST